MADGEASGGSDMHANVGRVAAAARAAGLQIEIRRFPDGTRTAADAARAVGCDVSQIVKSLVFVAGDQPVLALVSGADRADPDRLPQRCGWMAPWPRGQSDEPAPTKRTKRPDSRSGEYRPWDTPGRSRS